MKSANSVPRVRSISQSGALSRMCRWKPLPAFPVSSTASRMALVASARLSNTLEWISQLPVPSVYQ